MNIKDLLAKSPLDVRNSPIVQVMVELIQSQAEQIQSQAEQIQSQAEQIQSQAEQIQCQTEQIVKLKETINSLKDEISRLNKTPRRPKLKPNKMEPRDRKNRNKISRGSFGQDQNSCIPEKEQEEIRIEAEGVPQGACFKGYNTFKVQEVKILSKEITYKLEIWQTPEGKIIKGQLPKELRGKHFGPHLRTLICNFYAQGMTQPEIYNLLQGLGIKISAGQINNLLLEDASKFAKVSEEILKAGLQKASYIRTDDTGARHKHKNGYCTHIGGEYFAYYKTTCSKSRANFLKILLQGREGYEINDAMIWHLFQSRVEDDILNLFENYKGKKYTSKSGMIKFLNRLNLRGKKTRKQCLEAALVGFVSTNILRKDQILLSDRAKQFAILNHAACWVHMERPLRKIRASNKTVKEDLEEIREVIWKLYRTLKTSVLIQTNREEVEKQYDALVTMKSSSPGITSVINNFRKYRDEMLKALDCPELPLHNNDSERDIRGFVKRRKVSGSTKSEQGLEFRDALSSLKQTCFRLGISFWEYSSKWFQGKPPDLAMLVRESYQTLTSTPSAMTF